MTKANTKRSWPERDRRAVMGPPLKSEWVSEPVRVAGAGGRPCASRTPVTLPVSLFLLLCFHPYSLSVNVTELYAILKRLSSVIPIVGARLPHTESDARS